ncbi:MFS transporter [Flaviaesturariibacter aridisoli]|uniref:MFS transporter n=1 Tax=Flaviaesturariibacter aridisoli TaxID=2545761 RepID=A0A4R4DYN1_9BACT|nr:MFS transporter [Flaviaesturariibacter aridisoli]TCZ66939.1 MFS transporter [Flaviaesturariibacter aridisoli]
MQPEPHAFSRYQKIVITLLALIQFTIILDFMVMAPLGDWLMKDLHLGTAQFGTAVSAYAFSAGISGLLAAGFADKYDRKKLLLFFYAGFILGTVLCATATSYPMLLFARIVTGVFGGVLGSIAMAIIADLFSFSQRGRVMGFVQMSFAVSQVAGLPIGLYLATKLGWHAPFVMIVALSAATALFCLIALRPVTRHLEVPVERNPVRHLVHTFTLRSYWLPYAVTAALSIGGFLLMPFSTAFLINNVHVRQEDLTVVYVCMGISSMIMLPVIGRIADKAGKFPTFLVGSVIGAVMIAIYTNLAPVPLWVVIAISAVMFASIMSRMVPSQALMSAIPNMQDRGAFMSVMSSLQQVAGGVASLVAGAVIVQRPDHSLVHFNTLGYVGIGVMALCVWGMYRLSKRVAPKEATPAPVEVAELV